MLFLEQKSLFISYFKTSIYIYEISCDSVNYLLNNKALFEILNVNMILFN